LVKGTPQATRPSGDPIGPGFFVTVSKAWGTKLGRRTIVLGVSLLVLSVIIVIGLVVFSNVSRQSQSYRDGYSVGGAAYAADAYVQLDAQQACKKAELSGPAHGGLPAGDDPTQWLKGCVAAFASAQSGN
jgi:hypothetical protein